MLKRWLAKWSKRLIDALKCFLQNPLRAVAAADRGQKVEGFGLGLAGQAGEFIDQKVVARPDRPGLDHPEKNAEFAGVPVRPAIGRHPMILEGRIELHVGIVGRPFESRRKLAP